MRFTKSPVKAQKKLLKEILEANKDSKFGQVHKFSVIGSTQEYAEVCPIQTYDTLEPYMKDPSGQGLTAESAVFYQVTSGTTGSAKYLPVTEAGLKNDKALQNMVALARYLNNPCTYTGKMFAVVSPAIEGYMDSGVPYGSASGLTYVNMPYMARSKYVVPYSVFEIEDYQIKYQLITLFALADSRVSVAATANPSTLVRLLEIINQNADQLLRALELGIMSFPGVEQSLLKSLKKYFKPDKKRAASLRGVLAANGRLTYMEIWPNLQQLVTWTGGSCGIALSSLRKDLPEFADIVEMGYLASEVRGTLTLGHDIGLPLLVIRFMSLLSVMIGRQISKMFCCLTNWKRENSITSLSRQ